MTGNAALEADVALERRVASVLAVAGLHGTGISIEELLDLLPADAPASVDDLRRWLEARPALARLADDGAYLPTVISIDPSGRRSRADRYRAAAARTLAGPLAPLVRWIRALGVTGSTAYGEPESGDDLDFLLITRTGALWVSLAWLYLVLRMQGRPTVDGEPVDACFNYAMDDTRAPREFVSVSGFLHAREALTTRVLLGEPYFQRLLGAAPWMGREIPRLYARRSVAPERLEATRAPWLVRCLNALIFPLLAAYLQAVSLRRNARIRRLGRLEDLFETQTALHRFAFASVRFDELRARYSGATASAGGSWSTEHGLSGAAFGPRSTERPTQVLRSRGA